jgi:DDE superfamily endonuclease
MGFFWRANSTAWMNYSIMLEWLYWFDSRVQCPVLLLMDNFGAHELAVQLIEESNKPLKWTRIEWFPENTTSIFQPLDQGIIQNWKCHVKKQLLQFLVTEFDAGRDYNKTHHVLRAVKWGIDAWDSVKTLTITNCWRKGFQNKAINDSPWTDSTELVQEIQATADILARNLRIQELIDINNFIDAPEERVVDSEEEITNQIVAHYSHEEDQELESSAIQEEVTKVSISEAIAGLQALKLYQEQMLRPANQVLIAQLQKELRELEAERANSQKQSTLKDWLQ